MNKYKLTISVPVSIDIDAASFAEAKAQVDHLSPRAVVEIGEFDPEFPYRILAAELLVGTEFMLGSTPPPKGAA